MTTRAFRETHGIATMSMVRKLIELELSDYRCGNHYRAVREEVCDKAVKNAVSEGALHRAG